MAIYRIEWVGGPLDGCVAKRELAPHEWVGPDPANPLERRVIYELRRTERNEFKYCFLRYEDVLMP